MITLNWKWILYLLLAAALLFCAAAVVVANATTNLTDNSTVTPTVTGYVPEVVETGAQANVIKAGTSNKTSPGGIITVYQRDAVYWGDVCDLSLVKGWSGKIVHRTTGKVVDVSSFTHKIYIDPKIFDTGEWDKKADFDESQVDIAFYVAANRPPGSRNTTTVLEPNTTSIKPNIQPIPVKHVGDILVARGDPLNIAFRNAKIWIFGRINGYYDFTTVNGDIQINKTMISRLEPGNYVLVAEEYGDSPNYNVRYNAEKDWIEYFDPVQFKIQFLELYGLDPRTRLDKFRKLKELTNDTFTEYDLIVADPSVDITSTDQQYINKTVFTQTVRGYTNVAKGTELTFTVDKDVLRRDPDVNRTKYSVFTDTARGSDNPGDMRWFEKTLPLVWDNFGPGEHTITVDTAIGGSMTTDYTVYEAPEHSYIPNNTIKYINGSEWRPDPTPLVIEHVVTQEVIKVVTKEVPVPPPQESVNKAQAAALNSLVMTIVIVVIGVVVGGFSIWYFRSAYIRAKYQRTYFKGGLGK